jgi:hypothetical protein
VAGGSKLWRVLILRHMLRAYRSDVTGTESRLGVSGSKCRVQVSRRTAQWCEASDAGRGTWNRR